MMSEENLINKLRGLHFALGMLDNQQKDLFCRNCLSFAKTVEGTARTFTKFEKSCTGEGQDLPEAFRELLADDRRKLEAISVPEKPKGQKKEGNCKLAEGICFAKTAFAICERVTA
jgi:hypothetical protein